MPDKKHERYWDELDIDDELRKVLDEDYEKEKKDDNAYYRYNRSFDNLGEELAYKLSNTSPTDENSSSTSPDHNASDLRVNELNAFLDCLTKKQYLVFLLYVVGGCKQRQISKILNMSQSSVSELISRAKERMKQ